MDALLHSLLESRFGFRSFRPGQAEALEQLLAGRDALVVMPTGAGKSLIYQLASLTRNGTAIVVSPLISLMQDQVRRLNARKIPSTFINSLVPAADQQGRLDRLRQGKYRLMYIAPERLRSLVFQRALAEVNVSLLAVDEAHCISQWGHDFRPDYLRIADARETMGRPLTAALTATATLRVQDEIIRLLGLPGPARIVTGFNRPNLLLDVRYTTDPEAKLKEVESIIAERPDEAAIIYTGTRRDAEEVAEFVSDVVGVRAKAYHGGLDGSERTQVQAEFLGGSLGVVAATNAFGMGIDRQDVRTVLHFSLPGSLEEYYQEAGRAGRDGEPAQAVLLYCPKDRALQEFFIFEDSVGGQDLLTMHRALASESEGQAWVDPEQLSAATGFRDVKLRTALAELEKAAVVQRVGDEGGRMLLEVGEWDQPSIDKVTESLAKRQELRLEQLNKMIAYAESNDCRRQSILTHFGDTGSVEASDGLGCCDNCGVLPGVPSHSAAEPTAAADSTDVGLIILGAVQKLRWGIGATKLVRLLVGSTAQDMKAMGYSKSPSFGKLSHLTQSGVATLVRQLAQKRYLKQIGGKLPVLTLTPRGQQALNNRESIPLELPTGRRPHGRAPGLEKSETLSVTASMFRGGMAPEAIATQRGLSMATIMAHLSSLVEKGSLPLRDLVSQDVIEGVNAAIAQAGNASAFGPLRALLPEEISYGEMRCVAAEWRRTHRDQAGQDPVLQAVLQCVEANPGVFPRSRVADLLSGDHLERIGRHVDNPCFKVLSTHRSGEVLRVVDHLISEGALRVDENRKVWPCDTSSAPASPASPPETDADLNDDVASYLSRLHPRQLKGGSWDSGWALGFHSSFAGSDWKRSGVGQLAYRLKYLRDESALGPLIGLAMIVVDQHPELADVDYVTAVPPSEVRAFDHVLWFAKELASKRGLPVTQVVEKVRQTLPQKEQTSGAQKRQNVHGAFKVVHPIDGKRILLVDDLFDSGATLDEVARTLRDAGARFVAVLTMTRTIHSSD